MAASHRCVRLAPYIDNAQDAVASDTANVGVVALAVGARSRWQPTGGLLAE